jgi:Domain of unknown function (DUF3883)
MQPIAELLNFLTQTMTLMTVYQPAIILHLLTQEGVTSRAELARMLSGNQDWELEFWDRVLMKNPKLVLVNTHQILKYDKETQTFFLNFELVDSAAVEQAKTVCEQEIEAWIQKAARSNKITEAEGWRLYRILEIAKHGNQYHSSLPLPDQVAQGTPETIAQLEEFAMRAAVRELEQRYPGEKITQQPYNNPGFDISVGTLANPIAYVRVKATQGYQPVFYLSEGERQFSIEQADRYLLAVVYAIHLHKETYKIALQPGRIDLTTSKLIPLSWQRKLLTVDQTSVHRL